MPAYEGSIKYPVPADRYNTAYGEPQWWKDLASTASAAIGTKADVGHTHSSLSSGAFTFNVSSVGALAANAGGANTLQFDMNTGRMIAGEIPWARISGAPATTPTAWADVTGKPSTFAPAAHTHPQSDVTGLAATLDGKVGTSDPRLSDSRTPKPHEHTGVSQPGFSVDISTAGAFAGRASGANTLQFDLNTGRMVAGIVPWARLTDTPATFPPAAHTHDDRYYTETETDTKLDAATWYRGGLSAASPVNGPLGSIRDGGYRITLDSTAASLAMPFGRAGKFAQVSYGTFGIQSHDCVEGVSVRLWSNDNTAWGRWVTPANAYTDKKVDAATWYRGGLAADSPISGPLGSIKDGAYRINYDARAAELGITGGGAGEFTQVSFGQFGFQSNRHLAGTVARLWSHGTQTWGDWTPHGGTAPAPPSQEEASPSGIKRVPLALTLGHGGSYHATTTGTIRLPMHWGADVYRWRIHIRNANVRDNDVEPGAVSFPQGIWLGRDAGGGQASGLSQIVPAFSTPEDGSEHVTGWINSELPAGSRHLLSWAYSATGNVITNVGGNWASAGSVANTTGGTWTRQVMAPLDFWIEAETAQSTPVMAVVGDSLSAGTGSTLPVHDSVLSQHMRGVGGLPIHYASAGDSLSITNGDGGAGTDAWKKGRWTHLARPDGVLFALGSNDIFGGSASLATMQTRLAKVLEWVTADVSDRLYFSTITPRTGVTTGEDVRRAYNSYLRGLAKNIETFDFAAAISTDDENIRPEFDADTIHLTTAGYAAEAGTLRHLTSPPLPSIKTVDALTYRMGWRSMPLSSGWTGALYMKRVGPKVYFKSEGLNGSAATATLAAVIPVGLRPEGGINERGLLHTTASAVSRWWCALDAFSSPVGVGNLYGSGSWDTVDPIPTTPPGSAA